MFKTQRKMHCRGAHRSIAVTKRVSQTRSLTQYHQHKKPLSLKIPAAAIRLLNAGNIGSVRLFIFSRFVNTASVLDIPKHPRHNCSYPHRSQSWPDFQEWGHHQPSRAPAGSVHCVPHAGGRPAGDRSWQCQHCVTQGWWSSQIPWRDRFPDAVCYQPAAGAMPGPNM